MNLFCDRIANPNNEVLNSAEISIKGEHITSLIDASVFKSNVDIVFRDAVAFPGLINIHDHLKYSWFERIGHMSCINNGNNYYNNVYDWLRDLYEEFDDRFTSSECLDIMFRLGIYKQIFSATSTVLNHSRYPKKVLPSERYINVFDEFERELVVQPELLQKITKHPPSFGEGIIKAHKKAVSERRPFMIHAAEGSDIETRYEIQTLAEYGILTPESILVHCNNTNEDDIELIRNGKCTVVWCPNSSNYIVGKNADIPTIAKKGINICVGTDSSCSGGDNLLEELRFAKSEYMKQFQKSISYSELFNMVTINPARAIMRENSMGRIASGFYADIAIVDSDSQNPYEDIINSTPETIIALICNGRFVYGDDHVADMLPCYENTSYMDFKINGRKKRVVGDPKTSVTLANKAFNLPKSTRYPFIPEELH